MLSYFTIFTACAPVFIIIASGYGCRRLKILSKESDNSLVRLTLNLLFPAFIINHILGNPKLTDTSSIVAATGTGFFFLILSIGICFYLSKFLKSTSEQRRAFAVTAGLQNYGFIPIPIIYALFPESSVGIIGILLMHSIGVEIALWTAGVMMLSGSQKGGWKRLLNTPLITTIACLIANASGTGNWLHEKLEGTSKMLGDCAIPLSLLLIGATIYDLLNDSDGKKTTESRTREAILATGLRMIILPALILLFAKFSPISAELKKVLVIQAAMPAAVFPIILTKQYGGDTETAVRIVITTTLISIISIPPVIVFGLWIMGLG
ncbi:MAG: AEC family transporter [Verrucomicrobiota bacterium]|nr:AEC family transporter [Verrucomicrobiota bacterium]MED5470462.1 AEC family transporter [Verrucomicrobiota bacterium]